MAQYPPPSAHPAATVTISWNTAARAPARVAYATVSAVVGTRVVLQLADGSTRSYIATPSEAAALHALIGKRIAFRVDSER